MLLVGVFVFPDTHSDVRQDEPAPGTDAVNKNSLPALGCCFLTDSLVTRTELTIGRPRQSRSTRLSLETHQTEMVMAAEGGWGIWTLTCSPGLRQQKKKKKHYSASALQQALCERFLFPGHKLPALISSWPALMHTKCRIIWALHRCIPLESETKNCTPFLMI